MSVSYKKVDKLVLGHIKNHPGAHLAAGWTSLDYTMGCQHTMQYADAVL